MGIQTQDTRMNSFAVCTILQIYGNDS